MNACFYTAIDRVPLGTVAAIEFLPVIVLAALGARTPRNVAALALAVCGVYLLTGVRLSSEPLGLAFAFANAILFALYIVLADRVAKRPGLSGIDGLAASMLVAAVVITPVGGAQALPALGDGVALLAGIGVGLSSSVIPYVSDQLALARLARADLRPARLAAAGDRDRHRDRRAGAGAVGGRGGGGRAGGQRGGPASRGSRRYIRALTRSSSFPGPRDMSLAAARRPPGPSTCLSSSIAFTTRRAHSAGSTLGQSEVSMWRP